MVKPLGKGDVAARVTAKLKTTQAEPQRAVNAVVDTVADALRTRRSVQFTGFGTFDVRELGAQGARAPRSAGRPTLGVAT